ncbi:MAG: nucleotidyltransferase domain-containing protein [Chloroflexota bacterium]
MIEMIVQRFQPEKSILFGSQARGDADEGSDIDLLVVMPDTVDRRETSIQIHGAVADLPMPKDIIVTTSDEITWRGHVVGTVLRPAVHEGKVLYGRS